MSITEAGHETRKTGVERQARDRVWLPLLLLPTEYRTPTATITGGSSGVC